MLFSKIPTLSMTSLPLRSFFSFSSLARRISFLTACELSLRSSESLSSCSFLLKRASRMLSTDLASDLKAEALAVYSMIRSLESSILFWMSMELAMTLLYSSILKARESEALLNSSSRAFFLCSCSSLTEISLSSLSERASISSLSLSMSLSKAAAFSSSS